MNITVNTLPAFGDEYATQRPIPPLCVHQLVAAQAAQRSDATAAIYADQRLSYQALEQPANQLAHYLQSLGVGPESLVGVCLDRSLTMAVSVLAILKAGGAYVPLDPTYPPERLAAMLTDAQVQVLLTTAALVREVPPLATVIAAQKLVYLDQAQPMIEQQSQRAPTSAVQPNHLAYVIYTSGSTGKPKGVMMEHRPLVNLLQWHLANRLVTADMIALHFTPLSFDVSFHEIFSTWCAGGTLVITPEAVRRDPVALLALIIAQGVQKLYLPFVALQQLAQAVEHGPTPTTLREVMTAGEQLRITPAIINLFQRTGAILHNHYGATEIQDVTAFTLAGDAGGWPTLPPIGGPIDHTQLYLLDANLQAVPPGEPGELYIGGACLARGYRNQPGLTAARFMKVAPHHPTARQADTLYKTGDLARYLPDGNLEHLGRADQQVKIRGFRVELGEIESQLMKHPLVREAVVAAQEEQGPAGGNVKRLLAYVVVTEPTPHLETTLLSDLRSHLPDYMIPATVVVLAQLPLTPSGKVDRRALPLPARTRATAAPVLGLPQSKLEQQLVKIWCDTLPIDAIGVHDNFFELGGNSILMTQVQRAVSELCGKPIPIVTLFQYPTIHTLVQHLTAQAEPPRAKPPLPPASPTLENKLPAENRKQAENKVQQRRDLKRQRRDVPLAPE